MLIHKAALMRAIKRLGITLNSTKGHPLRLQSLTIKLSNKVMEESTETLSKHPKQLRSREGHLPLTARIGRLNPIKAR